MSSGSISRPPEAADGWSPVRVFRQLPLRKSLSAVPAFGLPATGRREAEPSAHSACLSARSSSQLQVGSGGRATFAGLLEGGSFAGR